MKETINCCQNELKVSQFSLRDGCKCQDNCLGRHSLGFFPVSPQVTWGCVAEQDHLVTFLWACLGSRNALPEVMEKQWTAHSLVAMFGHGQGSPWGPSPWSSSRSHISYGVAHRRGIGSYQTHVNSCLEYPWKEPRSPRISYQQAWLVQTA